MLGYKNQARGEECQSSFLMMSSNMIKLPILFLSAAALGLPGDPRAPRTLKFSIPLTQKRLYVLLPEEGFI